MYLLWTRNVEKISEIGLKCAIRFQHIKCFIQLAMERFIGFSWNFSDLVIALFLMIWQKVAIKIQNRMEKVRYFYKHKWKRTCTWIFQNCYISFDTVKNNLKLSLSSIHFRHSFVIFIKAQAIMVLIMPTEF